MPFSLLKYSNDEPPRPVSADRTLPHRPAAARRAAIRCTGRNPATRTAPALFLHGGPGAGATAGAPPLLRSRALAHRALRPARRRPLDARSARLATTPPAHLVADIERAARASGHRALAGVRRLVGLDAGAALRAGASRSACRARAARHLSLPRRPRSTGSSTACGRCFPRRGGPLPGSCQRPSAAICSPPTIAGSPIATRRVHMPAARAWSIYEGACSTLLPNPETVAAFGEDRLALGPCAHRGALFPPSPDLPPERDLVAGVARIRHLPATIVQGRYDMVCPIRSADELAQAWPEADYVVVPDAGHSAMEPGIARAAGGGNRARQALVTVAPMQAAAAGTGRNLTRRRCACSFRLPPRRSPLRCITGA